MERKKDLKEYDDYLVQRREIKRDLREMVYAKGFERMVKGIELTVWIYNLKPEDAFDLRFSRIIM